MNGSSSPSRRRVVIVGCGFAGLAAVQYLGRKRDDRLEILVFDRTPALYNYPILPRLLYEQIPPTQVSLPLHRLLDHLPVALRQARIEAIDLQAGWVETDTEQLAYDYLILAPGSRAVPLDKAEDVFLCYPKAVRHLERLSRLMRRQAADLATQRQPVRYAVIGGGLTGVEFATALRQLSLRLCQPLGVDPQRIAIEILEQAQRLLPGCHPALVRRVESALADAGVGVQTNCRVDRIDARVLHTSNGERPLDQGLCCIGSRPDLRPRLDGLAGDGNSLQVDRHLRIRPMENAYAVGDAITIEHLSATALKRASHARDQGRCAARNILRQIRGLAPQAYRPRVKPTALLLGPDRGLIEYRGLCLEGSWIAALKRHLETRHCAGG